jgi:hypothetical protein
MASSGVWGDFDVRHIVKFVCEASHIFADDSTQHQAQHGGKTQTDID